MEKKQLPKVVGAFSQLRLTGNVVPPIWYQTITYRTKRGTYPDLLAINLLADLVYWHRPKEIRDERTGRVNGLEKKFKGDRLQRDPAQIAKMFGCTEPQARQAIAHLEARSLVKKHYEHSKNGRKNWVMFLTPLPDVVRMYAFAEPNEAAKFDFILKSDRDFLWSPIRQDCEFANLFKPQDCELANSNQDCELALSEIANSQPSIYTENTITETSNYPTDKGRLKASPKKKKKKIGGAGLEKKQNVGAFVDARQKFLKRIHGDDIPADCKLEWTPKELGSLANLTAALKKKTTAANFAYNIFADDVLTPFLEKYLELETWYSSDFTPSHIYSHFNRIYDDLKGNKKNQKNSDGKDQTNQRKQRNRAFTDAIKEAYRNMQ